MVTPFPGASLFLPARRARRPGFITMSSDPAALPTWPATAVDCASLGGAVEQARGGAQSPFMYSMIVQQSSSLRSVPYSCPPFHFPWHCPDRLQHSGEFPRNVLPRSRPAKNCQSAAMGISPGGTHRHVGYCIDHCNARDVADPRTQQAQRLFRPK